LDTVRFTGNVTVGQATAPVNWLPPTRDGLFVTSGGSYCTTVAGFGSPHSGGVSMAFCDGNARRISFSIDPEVHRSLGNRSDGNRRQDGQKMGTSTVNPPIDLNEVNR
jgi:prepilin-type processing-associated H-X9-DG protein